MKTTTKSLRDLLASRCGYYTLTATLGQNGNGGMLCRVDDIVDADDKDQHLDLYELATIEDGEIAEHMADAGGEIADGDEWIAFDCHHEDSQGYLAGSVSRIYVNLAI
jgi:hypothetical protein